MMEADAVVLSPAPIPVNTLADHIRVIVPVVHVIGYAAKPHNIFEAIHEGYRIASEI